MKATIIIATYNEQDYIEECIDSFENQTINKNEYEILCIDGSSIDKTVDILKELKDIYSNLHVLKNHRKIQAYAFNLGIQAAKSENIFIVGAHAKYPSDFLEASLKSLEENEVDCVGGKIIMSGKNKTGKAYGAVRNTLIGGGISPYRYADKSMLVETVAFGCYNKDSLLKVGGYNENLVKNQDNDINRRIIAAGGKILFDPSIKFYYYARDSFEGIFRQLFNYGYWEAKLIKKNRDQLKIFTIIPALFFLYTILSLVLLVFKVWQPIALEAVLYIPVTLYFSIKHVFKRSKNVFLSMFLYFLIHMSIGIGFIVGAISHKGD